MIFFSNIKYWLFKYKRYLIALYYQPKLFHRCRACWWVQASLSVPSLASRKRKLFISLLIAVVLTSDSGPSLLLVCMFCCWWNQILNPGASSSKCCIAFSNIPCLCYLIHIMLVSSWILELHPGGEKNKFWAQQLAWRNGWSVKASPGNRTSTDQRPRGESEEASWVGEES